LRIPCCANYIQMQTFYFLHVPWEASSFHLKHHFAVSIVFNFTWYHFVLNNIEGVMIPCLCTLYFNSNNNFMHKPWGAFSYYLEHHFGLIIISLFNSFFGSFDCSLLLLEFYRSCYLILFVIFDPQYSLFPSNICLWICACVFTYFFWICTPFWRNSHYIGLLCFFCPFCQWMSMGEKF
jgi:hypothetical protein